MVKVVHYKILNTLSYSRKLWWFFGNKKNKEFVTKYSILKMFFTKRQNISKNNHWVGTHWFLVLSFVENFRHFGNSLWKQVFVPNFLILEFLEFKICEKNHNCLQYEGCLRFFTFIFWIFPNLAKGSYRWLPFKQHHKIKRNNKIKIKPFSKIGKISPKRKLKLKIQKWNDFGKFQSLEVREGKKIGKNHHIYQCVAINR
jgi:hypothetical protein